jgi:outer membrane protein TolC
MLKITIRDGPEALTFQVEGKLIGAWAKELELSFGRISSIRGRKATIIDLTQTLYIDEEGKRVLKKLFGDGAFFRTAGAMTRSVVDEITGASSRPWRPIQSIVLLLAISVVHSLSDPRATPPATPPTLELTLREALQSALRHNPPVPTANLNLAESGENQTMARSAPWPQGGLGVTDTLRRGNLQTAFGQKIPGFPQHIGPFSMIQAGPNFSPPLFDFTFGKCWQASQERVQGTRAQPQGVCEDAVQLAVSEFLGGLRAAADVTANPSIESSDQSEFFRIPEYSTDAIEHAHAERLERKAFASQLRARNERLPRLSRLGSWDQEGLTPRSDTDHYETTQFTGGRIQAQTALADIALTDIEVKKLARPELRNRFALELKTGVEQLEAAKSEMQVPNLGVDLARQEVLRDRLQAGVANNIEVIPAQVELSCTNDNPIGALYRSNPARADLVHATGRWSPYMPNEDEENGTERC